VLYIITLAIVALAVVLAVGSGNPLLALAAICGACGIATLSDSPAGA
jgi:hypothetical protein